MDFKKAFDNVDHTIVLCKLLDLGVHGCLVKWVASFLTNRKQRVKIGDIISSWVYINGGVPQGTKLAALLFLVMVNDFQTNHQMIKYVDDASVTDEGKYPKSNTDGSMPTTDTSLQDDADHCLQWSAKNKMGLNTKKTFEMLFTSSQKPPVFPPIVINGETIHRVDTAKLLGINISSDLTWRTHVQSRYSKATS